MPEPSPASKHALPNLARVDAPRTDLSRRTGWRLSGGEITLT